MEATLTDASYAAGLIFGVLIGIFGAILGILGGMDYFYQSKSRFFLLKIFTWVSILFSLILVIAGIVSLACGYSITFLYGTMAPGLIGLVLFLMLYLIILRRYNLISFEKFQAKKYGS